MPRLDAQITVLHVRTDMTGQQDRAQNVIFLPRLSSCLSRPDSSCDKKSRAASSARHDRIRREGGREEGQRRKTIGVERRKNVICSTWYRSKRSDVSRMCKCIHPSTSQSIQTSWRLHQTKTQQIDIPVGESHSRFLFVPTAVVEPV